jgi:hypothetical protein
MAAPAPPIKQLALRQKHRRQLSENGKSAHWINGLMLLLTRGAEGPCRGKTGCAADAIHYRFCDMILLISCGANRHRGGKRRGRKR